MFAVEIMLHGFKTVQQLRKLGKKNIWNFTVIVKQQLFILFELLRNSGRSFFREQIQPYFIDRQQWHLAFPLTVSDKQMLAWLIMNGLKEDSLLSAAVYKCCVCVWSLSWSHYHMGPGHLWVVVLQTWRFVLGTWLCHVVAYILSLSLSLLNHSR